MANRLVVLRFTGRKTGRAFEIPIGHRVIDGRMAILTNSRWRHNFAGGLDIVVKRKAKPSERAPSFWMTRLRFPSSITG